jgi:hypothetical protein
MRDIGPSIMAVKNVVAVATKQVKDIQMSICAKAQAR